MKRIMNFRRNVSKRSWMLGFLLVGCGLSVSAQNNTLTFDQRKVVNKSVEEQRVVGSDHQVITNFFRHNWFILGDAGINAYWGDDTSKGSLSSRLTPQFNIGFGKWFVPGFGAKLQFTGFRSRADKWSKGFYTHASAEYIDKDGYSIDRGEYVYNWDDSEYRREEEEERKQQEDDTW